MAKKQKEHPASFVFKEIADKLYKQHIQPHKSLPKGQRPSGEEYQKIKARIERNKRFVQELNNLKS